VSTPVALTSAGECRLLSVTDAELAGGCGLLLVTHAEPAAGCVLLVARVEQSVEVCARYEPAWWLSRAILHNLCHAACPSPSSAQTAPAWLPGEDRRMADRSGDEGR